MLKSSQTPLGSTLHYPVQGQRVTSRVWGSRVVPVRPSLAPRAVRGGSLQGGFQRAGKQWPDGTQIPAQRHPPSRVCTAPMLFALGRAFPSVGRQQPCQDVTPAALPGSSITLLARCLHPGCCCSEAGRLLQVSLTHSQALADAQDSSNTARRAVALQVPSSAGLRGPGLTGPLCSRAGVWGCC